MLSLYRLLLSITLLKQIAGFNPGKDFDGTFTVSLLSICGKEEFVCCRITGKCDEHGIYWKNADKFHFRFRFLYLLYVIFV